MVSDYIEKYKDEIYKDYSWYFDEEDFTNILTRISKNLSLSSFESADDLKNQIISLLDSELLESLKPDFSMSLENLDNYDSYDIYINECKRKKYIPEINEILFRKKSDVDLWIRDELIERNLFLVIAEALKYSSRNSPDILDLIQEGNYGLIKGIESFDCNNKTKLSTYVRKCIKIAIRNYLNSNNPVYIPRNKCSKYRTYKNNLKQLEQLAQRPLSDEEKQLYMNLSKFQIKNFKLIEGILCGPVNDNNDDSFGYMDTDNIINSENTKFLLNELYNICDNDGNLLLLIIYRLGLDGEKKRTFKQISNLLGQYKESWYSKKFNNIIGNLRRSNSIRDYYGFSNSNNIPITNKQDNNMINVFENIFVYFAEYSYEQVNDAILKLDSYGKLLLEKVYPKGIYKKGDPFFKSDVEIVDYLIYVVNPLNGYLKDIEICDTFRGIKKKEKM